MKSIDLYIDSGAFSVWRRGGKIDVSAYAEFLLKHDEYICGYMNLDVIPPKRDLKTINDAAAAGWENYKALCSHGLTPIPVYHMGEHRDWLKRMLDSGATHVGLGGVAKVKDEIRKPWLDETFGFLCGLKGYPVAKVHGFGVTSMPLVHRYPWTTTDSVSWFTYSNYGFVAIPKNDVLGKPDFSRSPYTIGFSRGSAGGKVHKAHMAGQHYDVLGKVQKAYVREYLEREGFAIEPLFTDFYARDRVTVRFFRNAAAAQPRPRFTLRQTGLFGGKIADATPGSSKRTAFDLMFTINTSGPRSQTLQDEGCQSRLLSYFYFIEGKPPISISDYASCGLIRRKRIKARVKLKD